MAIIRTLYLLLPAALTLISLVLIILTFIDQLSRTSDLLTSLYFLKVDTGAFTVARTAGVDIEDWYSIGLWNYCSGKANSSVPTFCSSPKAFFYFNPIDVWNLQKFEGVISDIAPKEWQDGLNTYESVSKWMFIAYIVSLATLGATTLFGAFAFCLSRGSSCFVTLLASAAALFTIAASATATALFLTVEGLLKDKLGKYGVKSDLGSKVLSFTWAAAALAVIASFAWLFSCCCAGDRHEKRTPRRERSFGPNAYARVPSPHAAAGARQGYYAQPQVPLQDAPKATSYEPYRQV